MRIKSIVICAGIVLAAFSGAAAAEGRVSFGISIGVPAPVYVAPAPQYYPPPVYYPYHAAPRVIYYAPPAYYAPRAAYYPPVARIGFGFHGRHGAHRWHGGRGNHHRH